MTRCDRSKARHASGFTLIEAVVVLAVISIVIVIGFPSFVRLTQKARLQGFVQEISIHMASARQEAIRRGVPVVVQPRFATRDLFAYANVDLDTSLDYDPDDTATVGTADYEVVRLLLPGTRIFDFWGPADGEPSGPDVVDGGTALSDGPNGIVFEPDGSVRDEGAIRVADVNGNFFEVRVAPAATGRVTVLKWNQEPSWGDDAGFYEKGREPISGAPTWVWYFPRRFGGGDEGGTGKGK